MLVQNFLRQNSLDCLVEDYAVRVTRHQTDPLVVLNYDQIDSPKRDEIVRECRALVLEDGTWNVVARSFPRFFNQGECQDLEVGFDWSSFAAESKEDGSLILLYSYLGEWRVNTRGSFGDGPVQPGLPFSWKQLFEETVDRQAVTNLRPELTYVFELCSPYNRVVRRYDRPQSFLLTAFAKNGGELSEFVLDAVAARLGCLRPTRYPLNTPAEVMTFLNTHPEATFEGVVLRDRHGTRLKVKNARYVALHHLADNGNVASPKRLLPLVLSGEYDEVILHLDQATGPVYDMVEKLHGAFGRMLAVWEAARAMKSQKDFAVYVTRWTPLAFVLFEARKRGVDPAVVFRESEGKLLKYLEG